MVSITDNESGNASRRSWRDAGIVLFVSLALLCIILGMRAAQGHWDPSWFILSGEQYTNPALTPTPVKLVSHGGYDGQFFYRLSIDPFTRKVTDHGVTLDGAAYRQQRILYPLVTHLLSAGKASRLPVLLIVVNVLALLIIVLSFTLTALHFGRSALWGLAPLTLGGLWFAVSRDLAEPLTLACLSLAFLAAVKNKILLSGIALSFAVLTRETSLIFVVGFAIAHLRLWQSEKDTLSGKDRIHRGLAVALPFVTFLALQLWIYLSWGILGPSQGGSNFGFPFRGLVAQLGLLKAQHRSQILMNVLFLGAHLVLFLEVIRALWFSGKDPVASGADPSRTFCTTWLLSSWIMWTLLASCFTPAIWTEFWSFVRVLTPWALASLGLILLHRIKPGALLILSSTAMLALAVRVVSTRP